MRVVRLLGRIRGGQHRVALEVAGPRTLLGQPVDHLVACAYLRPRENGGRTAFEPDFRGYTDSRGALEWLRERSGKEWQ